jgi:predicted nucleic-acid-binding Zn-ribbon protein
MVQYIQINKCNTTHKQNQSQKLHHHLNRWRKSFQQNSQAFKIKTEENRNRRNLPYYYNSNIILTREKLKPFFKIRNDTKMSNHCTLIQYSTRIANQSSKIGRRNKRDSSMERRSQCSLFTDDMILYLKQNNKKTLKTV